MVRLRPILETGYSGLETIVPAHLKPQLEHKGRLAVPRMAGNDADGGRGECQFFLPLGEARTPDFQWCRLREFAQAEESLYRPLTGILLDKYAKIGTAVLEQKIICVL